MLRAPPAVAGCTVVPGRRSRLDARGALASRRPRAPGRDTRSGLRRVFVTDLEDGMRPTARMVSNIANASAIVPITRQQNLKPRRGSAVLGPGHVCTARLSNPSLNRVVAVARQNLRTYCTSFRTLVTMSRRCSRSWAISDSSWTDGVVHRDGCPDLLSSRTSFGQSSRR